MKKIINSKKGEEYSREISDGKRKLEVTLPQLIKCLQVLKYIIKHYPNPCIHKVYKLIYLADRIHLIKYGSLITHNTYFKMEEPIPRLIWWIILSVIKDKSIFPFNVLTKKEIEVIECPETGRDILHNLTDIDFDYLSESNIECLKLIIAKYSNYTIDQLTIETQDLIYNSVGNRNFDIDILDMLNVFENDKQFATNCLQMC